MSFKYKIGNIETNEPWTRPNKNLLGMWYEEFKQLPGVTNYKLLAGDSLLTVEDTWDVDIMVTGKIQDYTELKNFLNKGIELGFKYKQLVDVFYCSYVFSYTEGFKPFYKLRTWKGQYKEKDGVVEVNKEYPYKEEVIEGLYKIEHKEPHRSFNYWKEMYDKGIYPNERRPLEEVIDKL